MKKITLFLGIMLIFLANYSFSQPRVRSDWRLFNQVWYMDGNYESLYDAHGPDVFKYLDHYVTWDGDTTQVDGTYYSQWVVTRVEAGTGNSQVVHIDSVGGRIKLNAAGNDNDGVQIQLDGESFLLDSLTAGTIVYYGANVQFTTDSTFDAIFGLCITDETLIAGLTDGVYFRVRDDSACVEFVTEINSLETITSVIGSLGGSNAGDIDTTVTYELEFYYDRANHSVRAYVNDVLAATHTEHVPNDELLTVSAAYLNGRAGMQNEGLIFDWVRAIEIRIP